MLLKLRRPNVLVHYPVVATLDAAAEKCGGADEDGGIFLGSYRGPHVEVTGITHSGPDDRRARYSFIRQDAAHQRLATEAWKKSRETVTFIGEWHTHPHGGPDPSSIDTGTWSRLVKKAGEPMVFVVVAPKRWAVHLMHPGRFRTLVEVMPRGPSGEFGVVFGPQEFSCKRVI